MLLRLQYFFKAWRITNNAYTRFAEGKMTRSADAQRRGISISYAIVVRL